ncbi:hypothetical protein RJ640_029394 [Escallonia rubra]|uniref:Uncharacterized protein n=1 Tax=Escallonia rubra TaxID=112253 RepID=A0AA88UU62_9ASTE|nr:hypothetical protein RJ640_029394 [Escallonia rubra]
MEIERRPYHRNCTCALHNMKNVYSSSCYPDKNVLSAKRRSWTLCSLSIEVPNFSSPSLPSSSSRGTLYM